jgi:iron complex transport system substrate-binding protein
MGPAFAAMLAFFLPFHAAADEPPPRRVVSIHLCADQLLLALADRSQIASVSRFAIDPERSHMVAAARGFPLNRGQAEEVIAHRPDLVLAGARSARATVRTLAKLGYRVVDLPLARDFDDIRAQITRVAALLGHGERGTALIAAMDGTLRRARADAAGIRPVAAIYQPMGFTSGRGSLEHALLTAAGFANLADRLGYRAFGHLPLERLVTERPDVVIDWMGHDDDPSLARQGYRHPAFARGSWRIVALPQKYWSCGMWYSAEAVARLAAVRRQLEARRGR